MMKQASTTNTLASPRIRARNLEKAKIMIGSRVPVITQSVTPTAGTAVTTGSVQYLDVGLQLAVQPDVHPDGVVAITVDLQVSNILKEVRVVQSGTLAYEIGTRDASTLLSLKDGDTAILGGLISDRDTRNAATVPGLGDIPVLGRLFGDHSSDKGKSEIIMSITPRIIRSSRRASSSDTEFWYGTESNTRTAPLGAQSSAPSMRDEPTDASVSAPAGSSAPGGLAMAPTVATPAEVSTSARGMTTAATVPNASSYGAAVVAPTPVTAAATMGEPDAPPAPQGPPSLGWDAPSAVQVGDQFSVVLTLESDDALVRLRSQARYNPSVLRLDSAEAGDVVPPDLQAGSAPKINAAVGNVQMMVAGTNDLSVKGSGKLMVLHFTALAASGSTPISLQFSATGSNQRDVGAMVPRPLAIAVSQ